MPDNQIQLAVLDMAGTTVTDDGLVLRAFEAAATAVGVPGSGEERESARTYVRDTMGQSKIEVFRDLFDTEDRPSRLTRPSSRPTTTSSTAASPPIHGAAQAITRLREAGVRSRSPPASAQPPSSASGRARLDGPRRPGARPRRRRARAALSRPDPERVAAHRHRRCRQGRRAGRHHQRHHCPLRAGASIVAGTLTGAHDATPYRRRSHPRRRLGDRLRRTLPARPLIKKES